MTTLECPVCQCYFTIKHSRLKNGRGKHCSKKCYWESKKRSAEYICRQCGKKIEGKPGSKRKYCSRSCSSKHRIMSEEAKDKIRQYRTGKKVSEETKQKISTSHKRLNRKLTKSHKEKLLKACTGKKYWLGRKHSKEVIKRMREIKRGDKNPFFGKTHSPELKKKMADRWRGAGSPAWKGGIAQENIKDRTIAANREWRVLVFKRDKYTCRECGDKTGGNLNAHHIKHFSEYPSLRFETSNGITLCKPCHIRAHK